MKKRQSTQFPTRFQIASAILFCAGIVLCSIVGCGKGKPSGCPKDLPIPDQMETLGSSFDQNLFVLRLRTTEYKMDEIVDEIRTKMKESEWNLKSDSATDNHGGELIFSKEDSRQCTIFISPTSGSDSKSINVDIKCDRQSSN